LHPWVLEKRKQQGSETYNEWAEWLVNQFETYVSDEQRIPANKKYKDWKP
jgi:hypothetical protein